MASKKSPPEIARVAAPPFIARVTGWVSLDDDPLSGIGHLDLVASGEHGAVRIGITCADRSVSSDLPIDRVRGLADLARSGARVLRAQVDVSLSGILSPTGGLVLLTEEPGEIVAEEFPMAGVVTRSGVVVEARSDRVRVSIVTPGRSEIAGRSRRSGPARSAGPRSRSSRVVVRMDHLGPAIRALGMIAGTDSILPRSRA